MTTTEALASSSGPAPSAQGQATRGNPRARGSGRRGRPKPANGPSAKDTNGFANISESEQQAQSSLAFRPTSLPPAIQHQDPGTSGQEKSDAVKRAPHQRKPRSKALGSSDGRAQTASRPQAGGELRGERSRQHQNAANSRLPGGRRFGGQLTSDHPTEQAAGQDSILNGDAPEFRPGEPLTQGPSAPKKQPRAPHSKSAARTRRMSKSTAHDIATRTHEDITNGFYECPICTSEVLRNSKVWSCKTCWTVFHLSCIKKWSKNEGSAQAQSQQGDAAPPPRMWRCPGCNLPKDVLPSTYVCWCAKEVEPRSLPGLPPHSCGQTCGKTRLLPKKCPHPCELLCHAGPCPPCAHMGPTQSCFCGKEASTRRCVDTNYDKGWNCGQICGDLMPCGQHECQRECHEGLCGACEVPVDAHCYCGKSKTDIPCCDLGEEKESNIRSEEGHAVGHWIGSFSCKSECSRAFDCGKHSCEKECHAQQAEPEHCPRAADVISHCPCGKTPLQQILETPRTACIDPIPNCSEKCLRKLPCGHLCQQVCHAGECMPCLQTVSINCRCGRTTLKTICHQGSEEAPQCMRTCRVTLNCGRHECGERCCTGERKASERLSSKKKLRPLGSTPHLFGDGYEAEHICTRLCGRPLKCGNHTCQELCHKGPCGSCREAVFDEISCDCGRTVLQPPLPCGTKPPPCRFSCERPKSCGHPQVAHNCHGDEESCPKCPFLMQKGCLCGKRTLKNQPCWLKDARCGEICGTRLRCGSHFCRKSCHRPGACEDAEGPCQQPCGKAKKTCGHPCEDTCHAPSSCREEKPCQRKILITCECQHLKQEMRCNASKNSEGNSSKSLQCDDECARLERNRKLALALEIDPETHKDGHIPYSTETLKLFQQNTKWAQTQERQFRVFAADEDEKRFRFKPMPPQQRGFVHALAEDFGLDSESMDPEPHRHVAVFKTPRFVMAPMKTLAQCVEIGASSTDQRSTTALATNTTNSTNNIETPYNAFLLGNPKFGLTVEELQSALGAAFQSRLTIPHTLSISFLPSEEIVLKPTFKDSVAPSELTLASFESPLRGLLPHLSSIATSPPHALASTIQLCHVDSSFNVLRRELDSSSAGGWSQVVAKAAKGGYSTPPRAPLGRSAVGGGTVFTVLGKANKDKSSTIAAKKKKPEKPEVVVEDWEKAEEEEERMEQAGHALVASEGGGEASLQRNLEHGVIQERKEEVDGASIQTEHDATKELEEAQKEETMELADSEVKEAGSSAAAEIKTESSTPEDKV